ISHHVAVRTKFLVSFGSTDSFHASILFAASWNRQRVDVVSHVDLDPVMSDVQYPRLTYSALNSDVNAFLTNAVWSLSADFLNFLSSCSSSFLISFLISDLSEPVRSS